MDEPGEISRAIYWLKLSKGMRSQMVRIDDQGHIVQIKEEKNQ